MELILAMILFLFAFAGLGVGLFLKGRPPETACEGVRCLGGRRCEGCPNRKSEAVADD